MLALKSVALAVRRFPAFNGFYRDGKYQPASAVHVGVAIAIRGGGLAAPALHDVDRLPLDELMARMRDLVQRMRAGRIRSSEMSDATITVSSLGERGVEALYGIIYPPQVAIVGFGKVGGAALGRRRRHRAALRRHHHAIGRSSGERRACRSVVPGRDRQAAAGAGQSYDRGQYSHRSCRKNSANIAPEMDLGKLDPPADLREALDIDSMDFLNFVIASITVSASTSRSSIIRSSPRSTARWLTSGPSLHRARADGCGAWARTTMLASIT